MLFHAFFRFFRAARWTAFRQVGRRAGPENGLDERNALIYYPRHPDVLRSQRQAHSGEAARAGLVRYRTQPVRLRERSPRERVDGARWGEPMLKWALIFFLISVVAGFFGFTGI